MKEPDVYIGDASEVIWKPDATPDNDELLEETPKEVIQIIGFDPKMEDD